MKLNSHSDIYKWAFNNKENENEKQEESNLGNILQSDKEILDNKDSKDSNTIKVIQLADINASSKSRYIILFNMLAQLSQHLNLIL
jgi:hypothetical protein